MYKRYQHLHKIGKRKCYICKKILPLTFEYFNHSSHYGYNGFRSECKICSRKRNKELPSYKTRRKTMSGKYSSYKSGAKTRKIKFTLTKEEFMSFWQKPCFYCGDKIKTIGLDRIDNQKGYTLNNVVPCCETCNKMKLTQSKREFINRCKKISMKKSCYCNTSRLML